MTVKRYDPAVKAAFTAAALAARKDGKSWAEAFEAAKQKGYTGAQVSLYQQLHKKAGKKRGRRAKAVKVAAPVSASPIETAIDQMVREKVATILDQAIAVLRSV